MKTSVKIVLTALLTVTVLSSCKKDFTCSCTSDGVQYIKFDYSNMTEESATAACAADGALEQQDHPGENIQCSI